MAPGRDPVTPAEGRLAADVWTRVARGGPSRAEQVLRIGVAPLAAAVVVAALTPAVRLTDAALAVLLAFGSAAALTLRHARWAPLLPLVRRAWIATAPLLGLAFCAGLKLVAALPEVSFRTLTIAAAVATAVSSAPFVLARRIPRLNRRVRTAIVGSDHAAAMLRDEVRAAGLAPIEIVGRIDPHDADASDARGLVHRLGDLSTLEGAIEAHDIDLLVVTGECPRVELYRRLGRTRAAARVRVWDLAGFCEEFFGHVPMSEIDATWFAYLMHPRFREVAAAPKRAIDLVGASLALVALLPAFLVLAVLIRRDGGPALFRQQRIGRDGRPFSLYKLRTMVPQPDGPSRWSVAGDPRVTPLGRVLRRTHLDELPQLVNVLRGEMSLVGPRPEVPHFVDQLQRQLEFYDRRHLVKPGITGWAQVRCGYSGSEVGSAWKLCHDLYYVKHRSLGLDLMILAETVRMLFVEPHRHGGRIGPWLTTPTGRERLTEEVAVR